MEAVAKALSRTAQVLVWVAAASLVMTACGGRFGIGGSDAGFRSAAEELIESDLAQQIGLGPLQASCTGSDLTAGSGFDCTGQSSDGQTIRFIATVNETEDGVDLRGTNLLLADQVERIEAFAASLIAEQTFTDIGADDFECADTALIVLSGDVVPCFLTDPADGTVYEAPVTVDDLDELSVTVTVGDPIDR